MIFRPQPWEARYFAPRTGGEIAIAAITAASAIFTAVGSIAQGNAAADAAGANAALLRRQADLEKQQGEAAAARERRKGLILRGKSIAAMAGAGIDPGTGSPLDLLSEQAKETEFQAQQRKFEHDQRAWAMLVGAGNQEAGGAAARTIGFGKAAGAVFGAGAKIAGQLDLLAPGVGEIPNTQNPDLEGAAYQARQAAGET